MNVYILNLGINNLKSVESFFRLFGKVSTISEKKDFIKNKIFSEDIIVIPGNGAFDIGMNEIIRRGFDKVIKKYFLKNKIIAICLGLQLFAKSSDEGISPGLGLIDAVIKKIETKNFKVPLLGWYDIDFNENYFIKTSYFFNNTFHMVTNQEEIIIGKMENTTAMVNYKNFYGFQFHPEKSGNNGKKLLNKIIYENEK